MFPGSAIAGYLLMFITGQSVPIFVATLAFLIQTLGDSLLTVACGLYAMSLALGMWTGWRVLHLKTADLPRLYEIYQTEMVVRGGLSLACAGILVWWALQPGMEGVRKYVMAELFTHTVVISMALDFVRGKAISTLTGTDALIAGVGQSQLWSEDYDRAGHLAQLEVIRSLQKLDPDTGNEEFEPLATPSLEPELGVRPMVEVGDEGEPTGVSLSTVVPASTGKDL
jgi:hypothetical protein